MSALYKFISRSIEAFHNAMLILQGFMHYLYFKNIFIFYR